MVVSINYVMETWLEDNISYLEFQIKLKLII